MSGPTPGNPQTRLNLLTRQRRSPATLQTLLHWPSASLSTIVVIYKAKACSLCAERSNYKLHLSMKTASRVRKESLVAEGHTEKDSLDGMRHFLELENNSRQHKSPRHHRWLRQHTDPKQQSLTLHSSEGSNGFVVPLVPVTVNSEQNRLETSVLCSVTEPL
jgi:hypothetical protein